MASDLVTEAFSAKCICAVHPDIADLQIRCEEGAQTCQCGIDVNKGASLLTQSSQESPPCSLYSKSTPGPSFLGILGAIGTVLELAISRWARRSASASPTSSQSSINTQSHPRFTRRNRRNNLSDHTSAQSENNTRAWIRAREKSGKIPREFTLYLPPGQAQPRARMRDCDDVFSGRVFHTVSCPLILAKLQAALKMPTRTKRNTACKQAATEPAKYHNYMPPEDGVSSNHSGHGASRHSAKKGKEAYTQVGSVKAVSDAISGERAWWLDVASPTWDDLGAIGKLLHLHPLTLEDILQQDPREKVETFPKLGYYFIVFRAIESKATRENFEQLVGQDFSPSHSCDLGDALLYLVVFKEGICSFHATDISEHTDRARNRILNSENGKTMTSEWVAHAILDSFIDSFSPFLEEIEREVCEIERLLYLGACSKTTSSHTRNYTAAPCPSYTQKMLNDRGAFDLKDSIALEPVCKSLAGADPPVPSKRRVPSHWVAPLSLLRCLYRVLAFPRRATSSRPTDDPASTASASTLQRIARTRKLVTSLARLLATKCDVVGQVEKRIISNNRGEDAEVALYMSDIRDHILTLQQSLNYYERVLTQSHSTHLLKLRINLVRANSRMDKMIFQLTLINLGDWCLQTIAGFFSINVTLPKNQQDPSGSYTVFGFVLGLLVCVSIGYFFGVRSMWNKARRKRRLLLQRM